MHFFTFSTLHISVRFMKVVDFSHSSFQHCAHIDIGAEASNTELKQFYSSSENYGHVVFVGVFLFGF